MIKVPAAAAPAGGRSIQKENGDRMRMKPCRLIRQTAGLLAGLLLFLSAGAAAAPVPGGRVLKVAFPELDGISETDQYGTRSGLLVDYLNEIAKYTDWKYEYVPVANEDLIDNFLAGQYDLMGGTFYSDGYEEFFAYPNHSTGRSRAVLLCRKDDDSLLGYDLTSLDGKTIGVYDRAAAKVRYLEEFLASNDLDCTLRYYAYEDMEGGNLYRQLREGEVDMLLGNDLEIGGEFRMVTSFQAQPYYIVTTVGNTEILDGLNMALRYILESTPNFAEEVYNANFPDVKMTDIQLNDQELRYIAEKGALTVAVPKSLHPIHCLDIPTDHHNGMLSDLLEVIGGFTGLQFTYVTADTYEESIQMVQRGEADILGAYLGLEEQAFSDGLALSQPYISLNNIIMKHKTVDYPADGLTCGVLAGRRLPAAFSAAEVRYYDTFPSMLKAVNSGEVDYIYGVSAMLEHEIQLHRYGNVVPVTQVSSTDVAFAAARPAAPELLTILNKAVSYIPSEEKTAMLDRNMVSMSYSGLSLQDMIYADPVTFILILAFLLVLIMAAVLLVLRSRTRTVLMQSRLEAAEAKSVAKSEFLSRMSHEIRTPMNAIVGLTELASLDPDVPAEVGKKLDKIRSSSQYMLSLINDILDMSRIENGKMTIERRDFSLNAVLEELSGMMGPQAEQEGLRFQALCRVSHDRLVGDPLRLRQILTNLLSNAVKFTHSGGTVTLRAEELSCDGAAAEYRFSVADTGIGIPPEDQERIFLAFEQVDAATSRSIGTGLGLPISRNMARLMGGDLLVDSRPGAGSEFYMTLRFPLGAEDGPVQPEPAGPERCSLQGVCVLLAEDNDLNAEIAQELLTMQGAQVRRASDGQEAVELFLSSAPGEIQVILMDIQMPVMDGHQASRAIRASGRTDAGVPIVAMTANSFKEDEEAARAAGMDGFVPKPIDVGYLFSVLGQML